MTAYLINMKGSRASKVVKTIKAIRELRKRVTITRGRKQSPVLVITKEQ